MIEQFVAYPEALTAAASCLDRAEQIAALTVEIQQMPAPTGAEAVRANWVERRFTQMKLGGVSQDSLYNVYARVPGAKQTPALLVSAHTDTVFPANTDLSVRVDEETGRIYGPGIGDNSAGVAALLTLAELLMKLPPPPVDIWLVANTGEEGLGDLRGMRAAVDRLGPTLGAAIVIEGMGLGRIVHRGLGSRRYRITARAPGGHSWSDFGSASAIHVLVKLAADLTRLRLPDTPRTTYNIGRISGGRSVNTIAQEAWLELDVRSEEAAALEQTIADALEIVQNYQTPEWLRQDVTVEATVIGDRPSGGIDAGHPLVQAAMAALHDVGRPEYPDLRISSTDANIPLSRGIPAVCVGITEGGGAHRLEEWMQKQPLGQGMRHLMLLAWWASAWLAGEIG